MQSLAHGLAAQGMDVTTIIPWEEDKKEVIAETLEWHRQAEVAVTAAPEFSRHHQGWHNVKTLAKFVKTFRDVKIVNIHYTQNTSVSLTDILAIRLAGKKVVIMVHHPTEWSEIGPKQFQIIKAALRLSKAVVGTTGCMAALLRQAGVPEQKIVTIPLGVIPPKTVCSKTEARRKLNIPVEAFVVCCLSRLMAEKGIYELLEAFIQLPCTETPVYLVIAGDGPDRKDMEEKAGALLGNRIRFLGKVEDISDVYASGDIFALPSYWEGFGLVYVEAAFHGLPCIGTNVGGTPFVIEDGVTGLLVPPRDAAALTAALKCLRNQSAVRHRMGNAAQVRAQAEFTEEKMARRFQALFQSLGVKDEAA